MTVPVRNRIAYSEIFLTFIGKLLPVLLAIMFFFRWMKSKTDFSHSMIDFIFLGVVVLATALIAGNLIMRLLRHDSKESKEGQSN